MFGFRLFGFPVRVQWTFWVLCAVIGIHYLTRPGPMALIGFVLLASVVFVGILGHELGHAFARRRFRAPHSEIVLHGIGGYCAGPGSFTRWESIVVSAAGPFANLLLGGFAILLQYSPFMFHPVMKMFIKDAVWLNFAWAIINLLPVLPLDGGHILEAFLANRNRALVLKIGIAVGITVAVAGLIGGSLWIAILFGYLAYQNWNSLHAGGAVRFR